MLGGSVAFLAAYAFLSNLAIVVLAPLVLPLIATGSDKGCETLGLAVVDSDKASISLGTTATIQFSTTQYVEPQQFLPAYPGVLNDHYNPEIEIYRGLWLLSWFVKEFGTADATGKKPRAIRDRKSVV